MAVLDAEGKFLADLLRTKGRLKEHLNDNTVRIGTVKRRAAVAVNFKWVYDGHTLGAKLSLKLLHPLDALDHKPKMVKLPFLRALEETVRHFMNRDVVASRGEINILRIRLPDDIHAEDIPIESFRPRGIAHLDRDMTHAFKPGDSAHAGTIA